MFGFDEPEIDIEATIIEEHERAKNKRGERIYRQRNEYRGHIRKHIWYRNASYRIWLKKICNRKVRRSGLKCFQHHKGNSYRKACEFWWELY